MSTSRAWLLDWPMHDIALAPCEVIEIVSEPEVHRVPLGPSWCRAVLYWREQFLPLALPREANLSDRSIVVVAWQGAPRRPLEYAALALRCVPRQIEVADGLDCELPAGIQFERSQLRACFTFENRLVLVPELSALFTAGDIAA